MRTAKFLGLVLLLAFAVSADAGIITVQLGDVDNFHSGDPADSVYVNPDSEAWPEWWAGDPIQSMDDLASDSVLMATFLFDLQDDETVVGGTIEFGFRAVGDYEESYLVFDNSLRPQFNLLGWTDITSTGTTSKFFDFNQSNYGSSLLSDGQLDVGIGQGIAVDYMILQIETIPEPATMLMLGLGGLLLRKRIS